MVYCRSELFDTTATLLPSFCYACNVSMVVNHHFERKYTHYILLELVNLVEILHKIKCCIKWVLMYVEYCLLSEYLEGHTRFVLLIRCTFTVSAG